MLYAYKCRICGTRAESTTRADSLGACGPLTGSMCRGEQRRVFVVALHRPMQEHFNHSVNKPISDMKQYRDQLKRASDAATESTGIPHNFQPADYKELAAPD